MMMEKHVISRITTPRGEIQLQKNQNHYEIVINGVFVMATYNGFSEKQMFITAFNYLDKPDKLHVLIGGLGVGYTLEAAVRKRRVEKIDVVEIEPSIIEWNKEYFCKLNKNAVFNKKVNLINDDFRNFIKRTSNVYDIICVDVDNGPNWLVLETNEELYKETSLYTMSNLLKRGGVLSIWSASESSSLFEKMKGVFGNIFVKEVRQRYGEEKELASYVYVSKKIKNSTGKTDSQVKK